MAKSALRGNERSADDAGAVWVAGSPSKAAALPSAAMPETNSRRFIEYGVPQPGTLSAYRARSQVQMRRRFSSLLLSEWQHGYTAFLWSVCPPFDWCWQGPS